VIMHPRKFIKRIHHDNIVAAIREAEHKTSGEIRVFISHKNIDDPVTAAQAEFVRMGMEKTRHRNAVLIFVAPRDRKFAVIGDEGVHSKCGDAFWRELAQAMTDFFRKSEFTQGITHGVKKTGELLAEHFPRHPDDRNQLSDQVVQD
jgi:uncharacterized membrane protein